MVTDDPRDNNIKIVMEHDREYRLSKAIGEFTSRKTNISPDTPEGGWLDFQLKRGYCSIQTDRKKGKETLCDSSGNVLAERNIEKPVPELSEVAQGVLPTDVIGTAEKLGNNKNNIPKETIVCR